MVIKFFVFSEEAFKFSKFHENETKHEKRNFERGLIVKICKMLEKN